MLEKELKTFKIPYTDADLPINNLSANRADEIELKVLPKLNEALEKLRKEHPEYFVTTKDK